MIKIYADRINDLGNLTRITLQDLVPNFSYPSNHDDLFLNLQSILQTIPENQRVNLHYNLALDIEHQNIIPLDIDGVDNLNQIRLEDPLKFREICITYLKLTATHFKLDANKLGLIFSGSGLHILIQTDFTFPVTDIKDMRETLKEICSELNYELSLNNLSGFIDCAPFRINGTLRLPGTIYEKIKDNKVVSSECILIASPIAQPIELSLLRKSPNKDTYRKPDTKAILEGCSFLNHCRENPEIISRKEWFAMMGILRHLDNGVELVHSYSALDTKRYDEKVTNRNLKDWNESGPPYCDTVSKVYSGCRACPHFERCSTPLTITSVDAKIEQSRLNGFREIRKRKDGSPEPGRVLYDDLITYFVQTRGEYVIIVGSDVVYQYNGKFYDKLDQSVTKAWAKAQINQSTSKHVEEFWKELLLQYKRFIDAKDFFTQSSGKINFNNGILIADTAEFIKHTPKHYFTTVIPQNYDKDSDCPKFKKFLNEITSQNISNQNIILEFFGATLANIPSIKFGKMLMLTGDGSTGKSTLLQIMRHCLGVDNVSSVKIKELGNPDRVYGMLGKTANIVSEVGIDDFRKDSQEVMKSIVTGDPITVRALYENQISTPLNAKIIVACNKKPVIEDSTDGVHRRILLVNFHNKFSDALGNINRNLFSEIRDSEIPGIISLLIKHWHTFKANNFKFSESEEMARELAMYKGQNPMTDFCNEYLITERENTKGSQIKEIYAHYKSYCHETGRMAKNRQQLIQDVMDHVAFSLNVKQIDMEYMGRSSMKFLRYVEIPREGEMEERF